ncbi:MAG: DUF883 family protein [Rubrivivax sp.]
MNEASAAQREKLVTDVRGVIADAEEVLRSTADHAGAGAAELRTRMQDRLRQAKDQLHHVQEAAVTRAKAASHVADDYVHDHPWKAVGAGIGVGLILGLLISRR